MGIGVSLGKGGKNNIYILIIKNEKGKSKRAEVSVFVSRVQLGVMIYFRASFFICVEYIFLKELDFCACTVSEGYIPFSLIASKQMEKAGEGVLTLWFHSGVLLQVWPRMCKFSLLTPFSQVPSVA